MMPATLNPMRVLGVLLAVAATVVAFSTAAFAQTATPTATATQAEPTPTPTPTVTPTPTPTVTPTPTPDPAEEKKARLRKRLVVKRVYRDYRRDGRIDNCDHSRKALKRTLQSISDEFDADFPDFREAVKAAIKDWDKKRCEEQRAQPTPTATPVPTSTPAPPPVTTPAPPPPPPSSGSIGPITTPKPSKTPKPPSESDITPPAPTATPTPTPTATPPAEAQLVVTRPHPEDANLTVPLALLLAALLGLLAAGGTAIYARRTGRLAGWGHSWREAGYRATGAWADFSDWLHLGR
jgi:outer membrane biosynthesis protein TonB